MIKNVPASAFRMNVGPVEFGDNGEGAKTCPIKMLARSGQPIEHWFWGRVVRDMSGMALAKSRLPIDHCHNDSEVLGYLNHFDVSSGNLEVSGALTPFKDGDRASEIIFKAKAGVPYEASINFAGDGITVEEIAENQQTAVNGFIFTGPGMVIRKWPLRGVALCPYGADGNTRAEMSSAKEIPVTCFSAKELAMPQTEKPAEVAAVPAATVDATPAEVAAPATVDAAAVTAVPAEVATLAVVDAVVAEPAVAGVEAIKPEQLRAAEGKKFIDAFGDKGGLWFAQGRTYEEAQALCVAELRAEVEALKLKLAAPPRGEAMPLAFSAPPDETPKGTADPKRTQYLGPNLAKVANSIVLPTGRPAVKLGR